MDNLHIKLLEMLKWFHGYCSENDLQYFLIGGSMLGAVRHEGFIPWDDDIDIGLPRPDYEKLLLITEGKVCGKYTLESMHSGKRDFIYPYAKLYDTTTTLVEVSRYQIKRGVYIDIFPFDGAGDDFELAEEQFAKVKRKYNQLLTLTCAINPERKWYKNLAILLGRCASVFGFTPQKVFKQIDALSRENSYEHSKYVALYVGNWGEKELIEKEYIGEPQLYKFEDTNVYGVEGYDKYLSKLYGDYMTLPPVEKRMSHHPEIELSFEKSYLN